mgnify:CR=1 FL=1
MLSLIASDKLDPTCSSWLLLFGPSQLLTIKWEGTNYNLMSSQLMTLNPVTTLSLVTPSGAGLDSYLAGFLRPSI